MVGKKTYIFGLMLLFFLVNVCYANPFDVDKGKNFGPIAAKYKAVYLESEAIDVDLSSKLAKVKADYVFTNQENKKVRLNIMLPFLYRPVNLKLFMDGKELKYKWRKSPVDLGEFVIRDQEKESLKVAASFEVTFQPRQRITITATYQREFLVSYPIIFHSKYPVQTIFHKSYAYLVGTAKYWNHPIRHAVFKFRVPEGDCIELPKVKADILEPVGSPLSGQVHLEDGFYQGILKLNNWDPRAKGKNYRQVMFEWKSSRTFSK